MASPKTDPEPIRTYASREQALQPGRIKIEDVYVPEWAGWYRVKALTGAERDDYERSVMQGKGRNAEVNMTNARAKMIVRSVVDGNGELLFSRSDIEALSKQPASALERLFEVAIRLSGVTDADVQEMIEGFTPDPSDASTTT